MVLPKHLVEVDDGLAKVLARLGISRLQDLMEGVRVTNETRLP